MFSIPMRARFRGITVREGLLVRGDAGWGEWSPFLEYDADESLAWLRCAEEAAAGDWPEPVRDRVPVNVTVPVLSPEEAHALVARSGCRTAKVKVADPGGTLAEDQARLEAVRDALGPSGLIRVDANGAWDVDTAVALPEGARGGRRRARVRRAAVRHRRGAGGRPSPDLASRSPRTSRSAGPPTPTASATWRRRTSRCSRCSRSVGCAPACASPRRSACRSWSPPRWRRPWAWPRGSPWPPRCPS